MPQTDPHMPIARKLRTIETLKVELVEQVAQVLRGIQSGQERELAHSIGGLVGMLYFLARQMGVPFEAIDREIQNGLPKGLLQDAADMADLEYIQRFFASKR